MCFVLITSSHGFKEYILPIVFQSSDVLVIVYGGLRLSSHGIWC